jgi:PAS domain S-box-containing protein
MLSNAEILNAGILIVDDQEANVRLLEQMLRNAGYTRISSTRDPRAVCALHLDNHYDLILLDLQMPGMDGFQVMESLKAIETGGYLPVLAVTAQPAHKLRALQCGAKDFVSKPFDLVEVLMRVHNLLEVRLLHEYAESIINTVREPLIALDQDLRVVSASRSFYEVFKVTPKETVGQLIYDLGNKQWNIPKLRELLETILPEKATFDNYEVEHEFSTIGSRIMLLNARQIKRVWGKERIILLAIEDITERKKLEQKINQYSKELERSNVELSKLADEALRKSEERFRALVTASSDVVYRMSPDWREMHHLRGRDFIPDTETADSNWLQKYIHPGDQPHVMAVINEAIRTKSIFELEHRVLRVDGSVGWTFSRAIPLLDANGEIVEWFGAASDVTERKQAEETLRETEEQFRALANSIPNLAWWANSDGYITWYNRRWYEYTGTTPEQMEGWGWQSVHDPKMLQKVLERWKASIATGEPFDMEFPLLGADGVFRTFLTRVMPLKDSVGQVLRWFGTNTDISVMKQAEERLMSVLADLERSNKELEQFAYVASHDLQEPLRMISSYTQLLAQRYEGQLDEKAHKYIDYAVDGAVRMQGLINDLLAYSRVNTQGKSLETVDSHSVLGTTLRNLAVDIEENRAIVINDDLPIVRADATQLSQVFQNLISNSIKFRGADLPRINISARDVGHEWIFSVQDNGIGIEAKYVDKVFVIFQRLHTRKEYPGTGIGLAICKRIVERHGGRIWYESEPGKGVTFYFTLQK